MVGLALPMGGHLTHGTKVSFGGKFFNAVQYGVDEKTHLINYETLAKLVQETKPKLMWVGATAYPRIFDWKKLREIAHSLRAYLAADIAHIAGLVAGGVHPSPVPFVHIVTTTTHKTLRGPRGGMIMVTKKGIAKDADLPKKIDKAVFPGLQGGPHVNQIAAVAIALAEAATPAFHAYAKQVVANARTLAGELARLNWRVVSGGTDTHLFLVDTWQRGIGGKRASEMLERVGIIVNKNTIPYDTRSPVDPSGIRIGTAALTTRGMREREMKVIAGLIDETLRGASTTKIRKNVLALARKFPLP